MTQPEEEEPMRRVTTGIGMTIVCWLLVVTTAGAGLGAAMDAAAQTPVIPDRASPHSAYTRNMGQWPDYVLYRAATPDATLWLTSTGIYYQFTRRTESPDTNPGSHREETSGRVDQIIVKATFMGSDPNPEVVGEGLSEYTSNYFFGNDPAAWQTDVQNFRAVTIRNVYPGVDIRFSADAQGRAVYKYVADDGADIGQIRIAYEGGEEISAAGDQTPAVRTIWGDEVEIIAVPRDMVDLSAARLLVSSQTEPQAENPGRVTSAGVTVSYSTYLGGSSSDAGWDVAADADGNVYVTGETYSADFPLQDPYQTAPGPGNADMFLAKFSVNGDLLFSTYIGGDDLDKAYRIALDAGGNPHVAGYTTSFNFPTMNPYQLMRGVVEVFVLKLSSEGDDLIFSTYLGGSRTQDCWGIAVDASGCTYLTGMTNSLDFPTQNPLMTHSGPIDQEEAFVSKLSPDGSSLIFSTYLGGSLGDAGEGIAVDDEGCVYVAGGTTSSDFPTKNPYQTRQSYSDIFVTKFSPAGDSLVYSTYLGGSAGDWPVGIAVDAGGNACVVGMTNSDDYPTRYPYQTYQGSWDVCITKLSATGNSLIHSTYLGGSSLEQCRDFAVDSRGNVYVTGHTLSADFPTENAFQEDQPGEDGFVAKLPAGGYRLIYSTYLGGSDTDHSYGIATDVDGNAYVTGRTYSSDFPTLNAYQPDNSVGDADAFLTKFDAFETACCFCESRGNIDDSPDCLITMGDLTVLIDNLFISLAPLACPVAANIDLSSDELITMGDLTVLIDNLFISLTPLPPCL
jgi:hypothetical protein